MNDLKKIILAGIGGATMTVEKLEEAINTLSLKGQISVDEGKALSEELIRKGKGKFKQGDDLSKEEIQEVLMQMNIAQREDIAALEKKVAELNEQIENLVNKE
ncbi:phasin family protein [Pisciglobus halotolerans]|uniref:Polyhydroxyalkanoate synthesis regulator phasin n=1 Tax=Pisciglobus halotolerans TaxID=745365 RepID=A0A1I3DJ05_9LACT|nr:hypothetical protein [Pisciglobus halotolerans]SFH86508.1 Polyhydroxyalkanoate synthesis regulator phasin [Pisciglobus halotolerans]